MPDIKMVKADVDKSAASIEAATDHLAGVDIAGPFDAIAKAMHGSLSAAAAKKAGTNLDRDRDAWVKQARAHHKMTVADANHIHQTDIASGAAGDVRTRSLSGGTSGHVAARLGGAQ